MTSTSENWTVTIPARHLVATVGGHAELSCELSPPRSAECMEVRWFRGDNSKLVHLYRDGHEVNGDAAPAYVNRTEFVKEAIRQGKVTLRLRNISVSDDGSYQCSFKGNGISDVASMNLSIAEQFTVNGIEGPVLAPLGGKVELSCQLSPPQSAEHTEIRWFRNHYKKPVHLYKDGKNLYGETISNYVERTELLTDAIGEATSLEMQILVHHPNAKGLLVECNSGVPVSDPHFELDAMWLEDMTVILCVLMVFITVISSSAHFRLRGLPPLNAKPLLLQLLLQTQTPSQLAVYRVPQPGIEPVTPAVEVQFPNR
ncbi:hypothetical protein JEQ12_000307 [Ovis aries]|uniref:Ig-like domain-containing protein n=1 Tax=Ovis aries TaxID=9940 RepID=A0A836D6F0_SHEEP|nr:hypothetical protein JEQ12_000307 [Ovis aries]